MAIWCWAPQAAAIPPASSATPSPAQATGQPQGQSTEAALRIRAQELAGEIQSDGLTLDETDAAYNAALIRYQQLTSRESALRGAMAHTNTLVDAAREQLKQEAIVAYVTGGGPAVSYRPHDLGGDPNLAQAYAEIVTDGQKQIVRNYGEMLSRQRSQSKALDSAAEQAQVVLAAARSDRASAQATLARQQRTLAQVNGQMAVLVAQVQAEQQQQQAAAVKASLSSRRDLPPQSPPVPPSAPATPSAPTTPVAPPAPHTTTSDPGTSVATSSPATTDAAPPVTSPGPAPQPSTAAPAQNPGVEAALAYARAQLGKPYQWGGAGPASFDCSGLVMMAWAQAGVHFPHLAQDQYDMTARIPLSQLLPGDLVFFGTPSNVYHVGIYVGSGQMIDAPETGQNVSVQPIYWSSLLGAGRVTA